MANNQQNLQANLKRARILVVEDNDDYWLIMQRALAQILPEVRLLRASDREQACSLLRDWSVDDLVMLKLVLLDLYLPHRQDGWQVLTVIKALAPPFNQVPIVMLSSSNLQADINEAYRRGCSAFLVKPTSFTEWLSYFQQLRSYWWETVTLPSVGH